jgi:hypothetical protein
VKQLQPALSRLKRLEKRKQKTKTEKKLLSSLTHLPIPVKPNQLFPILKQQKLTPSSSPASPSPTQTPAQDKN